MIVQHCPYQSLFVKEHSMEVSSSMKTVSQAMPKPSPRRQTQISKAAWHRRYIGLNNKVAFYELRLLGLIKEGEDAGAAGVGRTSRQKRAYTLAYNAYSRYVLALRKHMRDPSI